MDFKRFKSDVDWYLDTYFGLFLGHDELEKVDTEFFLTELYYEEDTPAETTLAIVAEWLAGKGVI